ncbi:hypothetical protein N5925_11985, partial [Glaesserella parasuis]|nr:hypothetical protein [Glaesserella parasuis]
IDVRDIVDMKFLIGVFLLLSVNTANAVMIPKCIENNNCSSGTVVFCMIVLGIIFLFTRK